MASKSVVIKNFRYGLDSRRDVLTSQPGTLVTLQNAHINQGAEIEQRKAFVLQGRLPSWCFGLQETPTGLLTFGSQAATVFNAFATTNRARVANLAVLTIGAHPFAAGDVVNIAGVSGSGYNVSSQVISAVNATQIQYANVGATEFPAVADVGGTVTVVALPTNVTYQRLQHPWNQLDATFNPTLTAVNCSSCYGGNAVVSATFSALTGTTYKSTSSETILFYNGNPIVQHWLGKVLAQGANATATTAWGDQQTALARLLSTNFISYFSTDFTAEYIVPSYSKLVGPVGQAYTITTDYTTATTNNFTNSSFGSPASTAVVGVGTTVEFYLIDVAGGSKSIDTLVDYLGVSLISVAVPFHTTLLQTGLDLATAINASGTGYTAQAILANQTTATTKIIITCPVTAGAGANAKNFTVTTTNIKTSRAATGALAATGTLTSDNVNVSDADTVTIKAKVYTFKTTLTPIEGQVLIGADADASLLNLIRAINHSGTPDTDYSCAVANVDVFAATAVTAHAFKVYARTPGSIANTYATTETSGHLSWGAVTLTGGTDKTGAAGTLIVLSDSNGVSAIDALPQISYLLFFGTVNTTQWAIGDKWGFTLTSNNIEYTIGDGNITGISPVAMMSLGSKFYMAAGTSFYFSKIGDATRWETQDTGAGFVAVDDLSFSATNLTGLGIYQGKLAVFSRSNIQIYAVDANPASYAQTQNFGNIGALAPLSIQALGDLDVLFLSDSGVRSLRVRDSSLNAFVTDVGSPVDQFILDNLDSGSNNTGACAIVEPSTSSYWLHLNGTIYVLSYYPSLKVSAWSTYLPTYKLAGVQTSFTPTKFCVYAGQVYAIDTNKQIYLYGGTNNTTYDGCPVTVELPWLDGDTPFVGKNMLSVGFVASGKWTYSAGVDPVSRTLEQVAVTGSATAGSVTTDSSFPLQSMIPIQMHGNYFKIKAVSDTANTSKVVLGAFGLTYNPAEKL